jgi:integrase
MVEKSIEITEEQWNSINKENLKMTAEYLEQNTQLSPYTLNQYRSALRIYFWYIHEYCDDKPFYEIKSRDFLRFQNWMVNRGLSSSAIKLKRSVVSSFNSYIEVFYEDEFNTFKNYVNKRIPTPPPALVHEKQPLSIEEYNHLCSVLEERELWQQVAWVRFAYSAGCRRNETRQLLKTAVDAEEIIKDVEVKDENGNKKIVQSKSFMTSPIRCKGKGKIGKVRNLQFDQEAMDAIKKWLEIRGEDDCPYVFVSIHGDKIKQMALETGNVWCTDIFTEIVGRRVFPHQLRSSRATNLVMELGKDILVAQKLLGHNSPETTRLYVKRKDENMSDEAFT